MLITEGVKESQSIKDQNLSPNTIYLLSATLIMKLFSSLTSFLVIDFSLSSIIFVSNSILKLFFLISEKWNSSQLTFSFTCL